MLWILNHSLLEDKFLSDLTKLKLIRSGFKPKRSLEVIMFTSEEPTRFGISCLGRLGPHFVEMLYHVTLFADTHLIARSS